MKKMIFSIAILAAFGTVTVVNAEEIALDKLEPNTFVIGEDEYTIGGNDPYVLTIYDVAQAAAKYMKSNPSATSVPVYYFNVDADETTGNVTPYVRVINGPADNTGVAQYNEFAASNLLGATTTGMINIERINNTEISELQEEYLNEVVAPDIKAAVEELDSTAQDNGFEAISYDEETKTVTFEIADLTKKLSEYKGNALSAFTNHLNDAKTATFKLDSEKTVDLTKEEEVVSAAKDILSYLTGGEDLTYENVIGKKFSATVTFASDDSQISASETYNVEFTYDIEKQKDQVVADLVNDVKSVATKYGVKTMSYDEPTNTLTIDVDSARKEYTAEDATAIYNELHDKLVEVYNENVSTAKSLTYQIGDLKGTISDLSDKAAIKAEAKQVFKDLSVDEKLEVSSLVGKTITASVVFEVNGEEKTIEYKVVLTQDVLEG